MSKSILAAIDKIKKKVEAVPVMVEESCTNIAVKAQGRAPNGIVVQSVGNVITARGVNDKDPAYAAYREFGTGQAAASYIPQNLPTNWDEYAYTFFKTGEGTLGEKPYLFPSYEEERIELIKKIKDSFK